MRKRFEQQLEVNSLSIADVVLNSRSRHELPQLLAGLQYIFVTPELNEGVFKVLEDEILKGKKATGREGMPLWEILVLGSVRHTLNCDYDELLDLANHHQAVRGIMGVHKETSDWLEKKVFALQTVKDNVRLLNEEALKKINELVVKHGHKLLKKSEEEGDQGEEISLELKTDSYVVETTIHFPTDLRLLWDSLYKCLDVILLLSKLVPLMGWGKIKVWHKKAKKSYRKASIIHQKKGRDYKVRLSDSTRAYLRIAREISVRIVRTLGDLEEHGGGIKVELLKMSLKMYHDYLLKFIDQVERRILKGEQIPHSEKIFSIFEPHTEWISKGKAGRPVELGHRVLLTTDQYGFAADHEVMVNKTDKEVPIELGERLAKRYAKGYKLSSISFDRGFFSGPAKKALSKIFDQVIMPKAGKKSALEQKEETQPEFQYKKRKHSTIEANINELEHCGADRVPDKGLKGFKRYVAMSVLGYNIKRLGKVVKSENLLPTIVPLNGKAAA